MSEAQHKGSLLVAGATGSIERHVVAVAESSSYAVRALVRTTGGGQVFLGAVEVVYGDIIRPETLGQALDGADFVVFT